MIAKFIRSKKTIFTDPATGTKMNMDEDIYVPVKTAIMQSQEGSKGKIFTKLTDDLVRIIKKKMPDFKRSIPRYTLSIRLDQETRGMVDNIY